MPPLNNFEGACVLAPGYAPTAFATISAWGASGGQCSSLRRDERGRCVV